MLVLGEIGGRRGGGTEGGKGVKTVQVITEITGFNRRIGDLLGVGPQPARGAGVLMGHQAGHGGQNHGRVDGRVIHQAGPGHGV